MAATYSDLTVVHWKHIRRRGQTNEPVDDLSRATETHWLLQAIADSDGHRFGVVVIALTPSETLPPFVIAAAEAKAQQWVDDNSVGDPGYPVSR